MGQSQSVSAEIEIEASPETVRSVFLDFAHYKEWHQVFDFTILDAGKQPGELKRGDRIKVDMAGTVFKPEILENSPESFQWVGSLYGLFVGKHQFYFSPSLKARGGTTLLQKEDFTGLLAFMIKPGSSSADKTLKNFETFNADLKRRAEGVAK